MFIFELRDGQRIARVIFKNNNFNAGALGSLNGDSSLISEFESWVVTARGPFGLPLDWPVCFVCDLHFALQQKVGTNLWPYEAELVEGKAESIKLDLPTGAMP